MMRYFVIILFTAFSISAQSSPDLVIINASVRTMDKENPRAEALAVSGGRIVAVGTTKTIETLAGRDTRVIDAKGRLVLPGFNDAHVHMMAIGTQFSTIDLSAAKTADDVAAKFRHYARFLPKGRWILGGKLDPAISLSRSAVDSVTPDHPVFVYHADPASAFANGAALALARVTASTSAPEGGEIVRGEDGEPAGVLRGAAMQFVRSVVPSNHIRDWPAVAETASNYAASLGVTSVQDTHSDDMAAVYRSLHSQGRLKTRVYDCVTISNWAKLAVVGARAAEGDAMVRTGCVKGSYEEDEEATASLPREIAGADSAGLQVLVHAIGREANAAVLAAMEKAAAADASRDRRLRVEHAHELRPADLVRFSRSKIVASMQPILFFADGAGTTDDFRRMIDSGTLVAFGSDAPMRGFDPIAGIHAAVNAGAKRGITVDEAVYAYTMGSAYAEYQEKEKGSISVGKLADIVMLTADIFAEKADIRAASVALTVVNGRIVYENMN